MLNEIPEVLHIDSLKLQKIFSDNNIPLSINNEFIINLLHDSYTYKIIQKGKRKNLITVYKKTKPPKKYNYKEKKNKDISHDSGYESHNDNINVQVIHNTLLFEKDQINTPKRNTEGTVIHSEHQINTDTLLQNNKNIETNLCISNVISSKNMMKENGKKNIICKKCTLNKFKTIVYKIMKNNIYIKNKLLENENKEHQFNYMDLKKSERYKIQLFKEVYYKLNKYRTSSHTVKINRDIYNEMLDSIVENDILLY